MKLQKNLTKKEKRLLLAKDVLSKLAKKKYVANRRSIVRLQGKTCFVCVLGSLYVSYTNNKHDTSSAKSVTLKLNEIFSANQISLIERAYEDAFGNWLDNTVTNLQHKKATKFYDKYKTDEERLIAIMNNIIKNDGTFDLH